MDDLSERFRGLDQIEAPNVWSQATSRQPTPQNEPSLGRRVAVIAFASVIALGAFGVVVLALRERPAPAPSSEGGRALVESGATYLLSDFHVEYPVPPPWQAEGRYASVTYAVRWSSDTFPGDADCQLRLLDAEDGVAAVYDTGFISIGAGPTEAEAVIRVPGKSVPVAAEGECGVGLVPDGSTEYVFSNLVVQDGRLMGDVAGSSGPPLGDFACGIRVVGADGHQAVTVLDYAGGTGKDQMIASLGGKVADGSQAEIRCEAYRSEEQFERTYWLPWVDASGSATPSDHSFGDLSWATYANSGWTIDHPYWGPIAENIEGTVVSFSDLQGEPYLSIRRVRDTSDTEDSSFPLSLDTAQDAVEDGVAVKVLPFWGNGRAFELVVDATYLDPASQFYSIVQRMVMSIQFEA